MGSFELHADVLNTCIDSKRMRFQKGEDMSTQRYIRWFSEIGIGDVGLVGGKNASLGDVSGTNIERDSHSERLCRHRSGLSVFPQSEWSGWPS